MSKISRYDTPAESNYFNTFVPLPLDQITALGMKRQEDLERKQEAASKYIDEASTIDYAPGSYDEYRVRNEILPQVQQLAEEAMSIDLSNPVEWAKYSTKLRRIASSDDIRRIEQTAAGYRNAIAMAADYKAKGIYNPLLDESLKKITGYDSRKGVYDYLPEAQINKAKFFEPYYSNLGQDYGTTVNVGTKDNPMYVYRQGVSDERIRSVGAEYSQGLANTGEGNQIIRLARMENPTIYEGMSDREVLEHQMYEYGKSRSDFRDQILSDYMQGKSGTIKDIPTSPYTTMPVPGQDYSLSELDQLELFDKTGIPDKNIYRAKAAVDRAYRKEGRSLNKPISEWSAKDFTRSIMLRPLGGSYKILQAAYKEIPKETRESVRESLETIPNLVYSFAESTGATPFDKAMLYQTAASVKNATAKTKMLLDPNYINTAERLGEVYNDIESKYPELAYNVVEQDGKRYKVKLPEQDVINNYLQALNSATSGDIAVYNIQDEDSWKETNDYAARTIKNRSAEIGGPGVEKGMRPSDLTVKDLGWDITEFADAMIDPNDTRVKLLGFGVDSSHPGTFAVSAIDKRNKKSKGKVVYFNADDVVSQNLGSAHLLLNSAKLKQEIEVPWTENRFIKLKYEVVNNGIGNELSPVLEMWYTDENGNKERLTDAEGNPINVSFDEVYRASLTNLSGTSESPIVHDRGKVLNTGY